MNYLFSSVPWECLQGFRNKILTSVQELTKGRSCAGIMCGDFLVTIGTAKRAPTFQINVAVTNFAPERIVSDKRGSAADKCIRIETYTGIADNWRYRGRKTKPSNDKQ